ncbi:MAG: TldD/PmbA family protein [Planctomycetota bacterium]|jgi:PmbA protein
MTGDNRLNLAEWTVSRVLKAGANQASVSITNKRESEVSFREKKLETLKDSTSNSLTLEIFAANRYSRHRTNNMDIVSLKKLVEKAVAMTKYLAEDKFRSLPDSKYYPQSPGIDLNIYDDTCKNISIEQRKQFARQIETEARSYSDQIISATAFYTDQFVEGVKVNSNGFSGKWRSTTFEPFVMVTAKGIKQAKPMGWHVARTCFFKDLPNAEELGKEASRRAVGKIGQCKIESGKYDMIVENRCAGKLIRMLIDPMSGRALQQKKSFLDSMRNKKIASETFTLIDDPLLKKGLRSRLFDNEAIAAQKRVMVENGILRHYYLDSYYARKLKFEPTTRRPSNLTFGCGSKSLDELVASVSKGILITGFIGGNSNSTTGDFSFGISGKLVKSGEIVKPVNEMTISGNALEFFKHLAEIGNDSNPYDTWRTPSMLFKSINFSGI